MNLILDFETGNLAGEAELKAFNWRGTIGTGDPHAVIDPHIAATRHMRHQGDRRKRA